MHYIWVKAIVTKNKALTAFTQFYLKIKTHFGVKIKWIQSDNTDKYSGKSFQSLINEKVILWEPTVAYNPHKNSVSERQNQTLMNYIHTILADFRTNLPSSISLEAISYGVY